MFSVKFDLTKGMLRRGSTHTGVVAKLGSGRDPATVKAGATKRKRTAEGPLPSPLGGGSNYGPAGMGLDQRYSPVFDRTEVPSLGQQFLPADTQSQNKLFREIATFDPIIGTAIEYWKDLAFSERVNFSGITDEKVIQFYNDAIESSKITGMCSDLLHDFLVIGRIVVHLVWDNKLGYWTDAISHDPDFLSIQPSIMPSIDPLIDIQPTAAHKKWATSKDARIVQQRQTLDPMLVKLMAAGKKIPLPPEHTIYLPRRVFSYDNVGMSLLTRVLIFKIYEAAIFNASVAGARRGAGPLYHITAWEDATDAELQALLDMFFAAEEDPVGAKVVTKSGVTVNQISQGSANYWKLSEEWPFLMEGKMRAMGVSESLLSGEANWNSMETIRTFSLEKVQSFRSFFTKRIIVDRMIRQLAIEHDFVKRSTAQLSHHYRMGAKPKSDSELLIPVVEWDRPITPTRDQEYLELLTTLKEFGVPINMRMVCQAAGYDLDKVLDSFKGDLETRQKIFAFTRSLAIMAKQMGISEEGTFEGAPAGEGGGATDFDFGEEPFGGGGEEAAPFGEEPAGGPEPGGGLEAPAPEAAPPVPEAGPGGAGGSLVKPRFPASNPKATSRVITATASGKPAFKNSKGADLLQQLGDLPLWDEHEALFGIPMRRVASILHKVGVTDPSTTERQKVADKLYRNLRKEGFTSLQTELIFYTGMRLGYLPKVKLPPETYDIVAKLVTSHMNGKGLTRAITNELIAISRLSLESPLPPTSLLPKNYLALIPKAENALSSSHLLTGSLNPSKDLLQTGRDSANYKGKPS